MRLFVIAILAVAPLLSCSERPELVLGEGCAINTDCSSPLGCRIGACRRICMESRDCGAGLRCLIELGETSGGCQLEEEAICTNNSECPGGFDCVHATCTLICVEDSDCPVPGSVCAPEDPDDPMSPVGCHEPLDELCIYDSDCPDTPFLYVCAFDGTCQKECDVEGSARDCPRGHVCRLNICQFEPMP